MRGPFPAERHAGMRPDARWFHLLRQFVARDLQQRYLGSLSGGLWALLQPLALLAIYAVVFVEVLKVRLPDRVGADFVPFLVTALWPWTAFAESLNRAVNAFPENASLLSKVALPREVLVLAPVTSSFLVHTTGFIAVLVVLAAIGKPIHASGVLPAALAMILLFGFSAGLALALASLQVFVRDLGHALAQFLTLLFFLSPVFYAPEMLPPRLARWLDANPISSYLGAVRGPLLGMHDNPWSGLLLPLVFAIAALWLGWWVFRRLRRHLEDFL
jgi:lipopolysaccharide transport system permease protein